jgi:hypothetical protein
VVPAPGKSVFTEAMSPEGNQQLVVINSPGDRLLLLEVGSEGAHEESGASPRGREVRPPAATRTITPGACA